MIQRRNDGKAKTREFTNDDVSDYIREKTHNGKFMVDKLIGMTRRKAKNKISVKDEKEILMYLLDRGWGKPGINANSGKPASPIIKVGKQPE